ncbi:MAG: phosphotransferase family protein [Candidatus Heimdallarchaeota archaeon]
MAFYEETNPADITVEELLPFVRKYFPDIQAKSLKFFYHGTYNVFDINQSFILRVADREFRNDIGLIMLKREAKVLEFLQNRFSLAIPKPLYIHESTKMPFSIHKKIPGKSLVFVSQNLTSLQKENVAAEIGIFLSKFHSKELKEDFLKIFPTRKMEFPIENDFINAFRANWVQQYEAAQEIAYKYLNQSQKDWLTTIFEEYLNFEESYTFSPRISHGDFDTSNILIDPLTTKLTGIIDFEECALWDPAVDLLFFDEGPEFMKVVLANYKFSNQKSLEARMKFFYCRTCVPYANYKFSNQKSLEARMKFFYCRTCVPYLVWGSTHNRPGMIEEGLRRIKKNMKMFPE